MRRAIERFKVHTVPWATTMSPAHQAAIHQPDGRGSTRVATHTAIVPTTMGRTRIAIPTARASRGLASQRSPATTVWVGPASPFGVAPFGVTSRAVASFEVGSVVGEAGADVTFRSSALATASLKPRFLTFRPGSPEPVISRVSMGELGVGFGCYSERSTRKWLSGRASPCQGEGRGFESRLPLQVTSQAPSLRVPDCFSGGYGPYHRAQAAALSYDEQRQHHQQETTPVTPTMNTPNSPV
jgi:hypothetical protein